MQGARSQAGGPGPRRAVFLDKDGTLVRNVPYNVDPAHLEFTANALEGVARLAGAGFALFVVTNQPGLASGRFTRREFAVLEAALRERVERESGVRILPSCWWSALQCFLLEPLRGSRGSSSRPRSRAHRRRCRRENAP